jgi:predicted aspartyl protease
MGDNLIKTYNHFFRTLIYSLILFTAQINNTWADNSTSVSTMPLEFSQGLSSTFVTIDNKKIPLLIDSGASKEFLVLSKHALEGLNVTYTGKIHCITALDGRFCMKKFIIPSVKVGNFVMKNVPGEELKRLWGGSQKGFIATEAAKNGLIGLSLLKQFNVLIDYQNHEISYMSYQDYPKNLNLASCHPIKTDFVHGIVADYFFNNKNNKMVLDTGANISVIKPNANKVFYPCEESHKNDIRNCRINKIAIFPNEKPENFYVEDLNLPFDGIIGSGYIQNHKIFIESSKNIVYLC